MESIVDFSIIFYRFFYVLDDYDKLLAAIENKLTRIKLDTNCTAMTLALDYGRSFRKDIYPEYKGHRKDKTLAREWYWKVVGELDIPMLYVDGLEADDICFLFASRYGGIVVSEDADLEQLTQYEGVRLWKPFTQVYYMGSPYYSVLEKIMLGDKSDNIPKAAARGLGKVAFKNAFHDCKGNLKMVANELRCNMDQLRINVELIFMTESTYEKYFDNLDAALDYDTMPPLGVPKE